MKSKKPTEKSVDKKGEKAVKSSVPEPYENEITNKLKESLRKNLQATKGFPEKLKSVAQLFMAEDKRGAEGEGTQCGDQVREKGRNNRSLSRRVGFQTVVSRPAPQSRAL